MLGVVGELGELGGDARGRDLALAFQLGLLKSQSLSAAFAQVAALGALEQHPEARTSGGSAHSFLG